MKQARRGIFGVWVAPPQSQLSSAEDGTPAKPTHTGGLGYLEGWGWGQSGFHTVPRPCNQPRTGAHWEGAGGTGLQHFQGGGHGSSREGLEPPRGWPRAGLSLSTRLLSPPPRAQGTVPEGCREEGSGLPHTLAGCGPGPGGSTHARGHLQHQEGHPGPGTGRTQGCVCQTAAQGPEGAAGGAEGRVSCPGRQRGCPHPCRSWFWPPQSC